MLDVRKIRLTLELREFGIFDTKVLSAIEKVPREIFIPKNFRNQAYENIALPIGNEQTISQPFIVALMTQSLELDKKYKLIMTLMYLRTSKTQKRTMTMMTGSMILLTLKKQNHPKPKTIPPKRREHNKFTNHKQSNKNKKTTSLTLIIFSLNLIKL